MSTSSSDAAWKARDKSRSMLLGQLSRNLGVDGVVVVPDASTNEVIETVQQGIRAGDERARSTPPPATGETFQGNTKNASSAATAVRRAKLQASYENENAKVPDSTCLTKDSMDGA